ncbi:MAG TPA: N-acetylmuramoyl-L-alanine amidase [Candidatus Sulfotelmatobacter sp.]|nr:N-acetylmuramoyl-L-alanine amidase [Candidatus Sulfotelmatobacter sp.]
MRWTSHPAGVGATPAVPCASRPTSVSDGILKAFLSRSILLSSLLLCSIYLSGAAPPARRLSVYSVAANYALPVVQRENRDYVGLLEVLEPLGKVSAKSDNRGGWRLRYNNVEADFQVGRTRARVQGRDADLGAPFFVVNNRGLVPITSLSSLLPRFLGGPATLHENSQRLFIGSVATHFTASFSGDNPPRLIFHFTAPVNPIVATEPGALRMTFSREPVVAPASPTLTFGSKSIPSAIYSEGNGAAVVTVNATIPVIASFSRDGRTVTIAPTAASAAATTPGPATQPATPAASTSSPLSPAAAAQPTPAPPAAAAPTPPAPRRYFAVVDASHGGDDHGETLSSTLMEKDVTVVLARSLRQELESRGIPTLVLRDSDANLSLDQRAVYANADRAAIYIAVHAASNGHGVRVYTALLPYGSDDHGPFKSWTTAQHASLSLSQTAANAVAAEMQRRQIPVRSLAAPLRPLNNVIGAAIAVEVAPQGSDPSQLTAPDYQQLVTSAIATAIAATRDQLGAMQ